ncbi:MAG: hypothetical protein HYS04_13920 [Acidobacteria bacterium]|nr:hypothetical protein [Acidobacteriota bacterium]
MRIGIAGGLLVCVMIAAAAEPGARTLAKRAGKLEKKGQFAQAYLLYAQAAAAEPANVRYWAKAEALRTRAAMAAQAAPPAFTEASGPSLPPVDPLPAPSMAEIAETRKPQPPVELKATPGHKSFELRAPPRPLFEEVARAYGLDVIFDGDYPAGGQPVRFGITDADYREALYALELATNSFLVPIGERLFMAVKDTPQKRSEVENTVAVAVPIPQPVTVQEAQELARSVQQLMEIQRFAIDSVRRIVVIRDRVSKVRPAQAILAQLLHHRPEVALEIELLTVARNSSTEIGIDLPAAQSLQPLDDGRVTLAKAVKNLFLFTGRTSTLGIAITGAQLFASTLRTSTRSLLHAEIRSLDGQPVSLHIGDKYPIPSVQYLGDIGPDAQSYTPPPTFNFEDLGLVLKITPKVHDRNEVSLSVEAEFKVLSGASFNGVPAISARRFANTVRLRFDDYGIIAGLVSSRHARSLAGLAGVADLPLLGPLLSKRTLEDDFGETLVVIKPRLLSLPPSEIVTTEIWTGTETRPKTYL